MEECKYARSRDGEGGEEGNGGGVGVGGGEGKKGGFPRKDNLKRHLRRRHGIGDERGKAEEVLGES